MSLDILVRALATELNVPDLALNANGNCQLVIDGQLAVTIEEAPAERCAHFYCTVGHVPEVGREAYFATLLEAQLFGREVGEGCAFGYDRPTNEVLLCRKLSLSGLEADAFSAALGEFVNWAFHWTEKLGDPEHADALKAAPGGDGFSLHEHFIRA